MVADYAGFSLFEVETLLITDYWMLLHDAVVYNNSQTEAGRDYLEKCWILEQTQPDRQELRGRFGGQ